MEAQSIDPAQISPAERYALLTNLIVPRPIAFVSTLSDKGHPNLAPFSYFNIGGSNPPSIVFSPGTMPQGFQKDTLQNIRQTKEYVVNLVTRPLVPGMNETSPNFPPEIDEWELSGLTPTPSDLVRPARIAESPAAFECRLFQIVPHGDGPGSANYVIGEIVRIHLHPEIAQNLEDFPAVARLGGPHYLDLADRTTFSLERPTPKSP